MKPKAPKVVRCTPCATASTGASGAGVNNVIHLDAVTFVGNVASGSGGGLYIGVPLDGQSGKCQQEPAYWQYQYQTHITLTNAVFRDNVASCKVCIGGGMYLEGGGALTLVDSVVANNDAGVCMCVSVCVCARIGDVKVACLQCMPVTGM